MKPITKKLTYCQLERQKQIKKAKKYFFTNFNGQNKKALINQLGSMYQRSPRQIYRWLFEID